MTRRPSHHRHAKEVQNKSYHPKEDGFDRLATAIVENAIGDYIYATRWIDKNRKKINTALEYEKNRHPAGLFDIRQEHVLRSYRLRLGMIEETRLFFNSEWFELLSNIDGPTLWKEIHKASVRKNFNFAYKGGTQKK